MKNMMYKEKKSNEKQKDIFMRFLTKTYLINEQGINEDIADKFVKENNPYIYMYLEKNDLICIDPEIILLLKRSSDIKNMLDNLSSLKG